MISRIRFNSSFDTEWGHWGFDLQLPSIRLRYVNFKNSAPAGSLQLTVGILLWSVWLAVFFDREDRISQQLAELRGADHNVVISSLTKMKSIITRLKDEV